MRNQVTSRRTEIQLLSQLALSGKEPDSVQELACFDEPGRVKFARLAYDHHVVLRAFQPLHDAAVRLGANDLADWTARTLDSEKTRIANALEFLDVICGELERAGCPVTVMKSLDHWPDIGNDLDLFTTACREEISSVLYKAFKAQAQPRSWGDRLADKCNYRIPGLRASVEVHHSRLGQTGEHRSLATRFMTRRIPVRFGSYTFFLPAPEERIIAATLQRMYRHVYVRVCDVANTAGLVDRDAINYCELKTAAELGAIWPGVASYLKIVSDYIRTYRGTPLQLPPSVTDNATIDGAALFVRGCWLRLPVFPGILLLYGRQVSRFACRGDIPAVFRLSLLPPLASAAKLACFVTGEPRGIW